MKQKPLLYLSWFLLSISVVFFSLYLLDADGKIRVLGQIHRLKAREMAPENLYQIYNSLPSSSTNNESVVIFTDARENFISKYLQKYDSPFKTSASQILMSSDAQKTERFPDLWRYILAIGQCESNLGKRIPKGSFNAWGLGVVTGANSGLSFDNWNSAIDYEAKFLRKLISQNRLNPEQWAEVYAPPSLKTDHSWSKCVNHFLDEIQ